MAFLWMDSFDHYATAQIGAKYPTNGGSPAISSGNGRRSSDCLRLDAAADTITTPNAAPGNTTVVCGAAIELASLGATAELFTVVTTAGAVQMCITVKTDGAIEARRGTSGGTLLGTSASTGIISAGAYAYVELKALISTTVGTVEVKVNGTTVLTLTGQNNANNGTNDWTAVKLLGNASIASIDYDDFYVLDGTGSAPLNTFLGDVRVDARMPTADGATTQWTPATGTDNYAMVDEIPPDGDTTYNSTTTVDNIDTFTVQDAPVVGATILAVQQCTYVKKSDSGTTTVAAVVRSGGTDYVQDNVNPTTSYAFAVQPLPEDPDTSAAWVEADFNAAEFGYKRVA